MISSEEVPTDPDLVVFTVPPANGLADLRARFGDIRVDRAAIVAPPHWESQHMTLVSDLPGVGHRLYINGAIEPPLREALRRCVALLDGYVVRTIGCFAPRPKRVNDDLSVHSWGLAVDLNADRNPLAPAAGPVAAAGSVDSMGRWLRDIPDTWVEIWEGLGWTWGGRFSGRADPQHFQWVRAY